MKSVVIYDSQYGNTEKIAKAVASVFGSGSKFLRVNSAHVSDLQSIDLLIVGSPTQGGRATQSVQDFLKNIPANALRNVNVAAFDTRFVVKEQAAWLQLLIKIIKYAAPRIAESLISKGGTLIVEPEAFFVDGKEGPLHKGELERAASWAKEIKRKI